MEWVATKDELRFSVANTRSRIATAGFCGSANVLLVSPLAPMAGDSTAAYDPPIAAAELTGTVAVVTDVPGSWAGAINVAVVVVVSGELVAGAAVRGTAARVCVPAGWESNTRLVVVPGLL